MGWLDTILEPLFGPSQPPPGGPVSPVPPGVPDAYNVPPQYGAPPPAPPIGPPALPQMGMGISGQPPPPEPTTPAERLGRTPPSWPGGIGSDAAAMPGAPQPPWVTAPQDPGMAAAPTRSVSVVPPQQGQGAAPVVPPQAAPIVPPQAAPVAMQPPPMTPQPPMAPMSPPGAPTTMPGHSAIGRALGFSDPQTQSFFGGLGAGLKEAGRTANMPAGAAFLGSAGAALEGTQGRADKRYEQDRQAFHDDQAQRKMAFDQSSTAFKDVLAAVHSNNETLRTQAQSKFLGLKGQAFLEGKNKNDWHNTPFWTVATTEGKALKAEDQARKAQQENLRQGGRPIDEAKIKAAGDEVRQRLYAAAKMDPAAVEKEKNRGLTQDNPFEPQDASQLHEMVTPAVKNPQTGQWEGGWFKDPETGAVLQFTKPDAEKMPFSDKKKKTSDAGGYDEAEHMALSG